MTRTDITTRTWDIKQIEAITEPEAREMALEHLTIKDHDVYFVDFGGYFGYSALVFAEGHHIHYANDYKCHHCYTVYEDDGTTHPSDTSSETLREKYISGLSNKLFTEEEIAAPLKEYGEFTRKMHYLHNYYSMRRDYVTIFCINPTEQQEQDFKRKTSSMIYDPYAFAYYDDAAFVNHHAELVDALYTAEAAMQESAEYWEGAFLHEMYNHEYGINWQADYDTLSAFGNVRWLGEDADLTGYFDQLNFNDVQCKAYITARRRYYKETENW